MGASIGDIATLMKGGGAQRSYFAKTRELAVDTVDYLLCLEDAHAAQAAAEAAAEAEAAAAPAAAQGSTWEVSRGGSQLFGRAGVALYGGEGSSVESSVESIELTVLDEEEETLVDGGSGGCETENDMNENMGERSLRGGALREARRLLSPMLSARHALSPLSPNSPQKRQSKHFEAAYPRQASSSSPSSSSAGVARQRFRLKQSSLSGVSGKERSLVEESSSSSNSVNTSREGGGVAEDTAASTVNSTVSASSPRFSL